MTQAMTSQFVSDPEEQFVYFYMHWYVLILICNTTEPQLYECKLELRKGMERAIEMDSIRTFSILDAAPMAEWCGHGNT